MHLRSSLILVAVAPCLVSTINAHVPTGALGPRESYSWGIRASHAGELLIAVGDSVDIVLLRDRCREDAGHGDGGCWDASTLDVIPLWKIDLPAIARVRGISKKTWRFGRGSAGARLYGLQPGVAAVVATLPSGESAFDSLRVIAAPGAVRILLEPKPKVIVAGDTLRLRVTARDVRGRIVAVLPLPAGWNIVGPSDKDGYTPVAFYPWETGGRLVARLGRLTDSLELHFVSPVKH
jgi:hypothetical protein